MKTHAGFVVILFCMVFVSGYSFSFGQDQSPEELLKSARRVSFQTSYRAILVRPDGTKQKMFIKVNSDGTRWMRMESEETAIGKVIIIHNDSGDYTIINNTAVKAPPMPPIVPATPAANESLSRKITHDIDEKIIDGAVFHVITEHNETDGHVQVYYINRDNMFIYSRQSFDKDGKLIFGQEYEDVAFDGIEDRLFQLPTGVRIEYPENHEAEIAAVQAADPINAEVEYKHNPSSVRQWIRIISVFGGFVVIAIVVVLVVPTKQKRKDKRNFK